MGEEKCGLEQAREFLDYVAKNEKRLKKNLRKNITFNDDYFDDVFNDSVIKAYDYIVKHNAHINDFEQFFFIVSKNQYIYVDNKEKKMKKEKCDVSDSFHIADTEYIDNTEEMKEFLNWLQDYLEQYFNISDVQLFLIYMKLKSGKTKISYQKLAKITQLSYTYICHAIKEIKDFCNADEEITKRYKMLFE